MAQNCLKKRRDFCTHPWCALQIQLKLGAAAYQNLMSKSLMPYFTYRRGVDFGKKEEWILEKKRSGFTNTLCQGVRGRTRKRRNQSFSEFIILYQNPLIHALGINTSGIFVGSSVSFLQNFHKTFTLPSNRKNN
jgi:hypothetical protein